LIVRPIGMLAFFIGPEGTISQGRRTIVRPNTETSAWPRRCDNTAAPLHIGVRCGNCTAYIIYISNIIYLYIYATTVHCKSPENELVVKADLPDVNPQDLDIRVEGNILTIRGERKFENKVSEENYLRVERAYGSFSRSFSLANSVKSEAIKADYQNGVLTLSLPKREEAKPKQIKVNVGTGTHAMAAAAGSR
jgi:HSP20 family protein